MSSDSRTFQHLDRLDATLGQTLREIRFILSLIHATPPHSLMIESKELSALMAHIARQLERTQKMTRVAMQKT